MNRALLFWPDADDELRLLESDQRQGELLRAVNRTLDRLEVDAFSTKLATRSFVSLDLGGVSATPVGHDDWYVFWQESPDGEAIEIILIHSLPTGPV